MIFNIIEEGNQMENLRWSCKTESKVIQLPTEKETRDVCLCSYSVASCDYTEFAITDIENTSDKYKNDYRKFLIDPVSDSSTFSFTLIEKDGTEHVIYSDTESTIDFGEVYEQGFNEDQPLQVGVNVIWSSVAAQLDYGDYTIKLSQTDYGNEVSSETHVFRVIKYDAARVNGLIKIEVDNVGVTMNGTNWTGLKTNEENVFTNMIRVHGRLLLTDPEKVIESIVDGSRKEQPVQTTTTDLYSLKIDRIPFDLGYSLVHKDVVMNWKVTDYNLFGDDFRDKEMIIQSSTVNNTNDYDRKSYELVGKANISRVNRKFV